MILKGHALHTPEEAVARVVAEGPVRGQVGVAQVEHKEARIVARRQKGLHGSEVVAIVAVPTESRGRHGDHPIRDVGQIEVESMLAISVCAWPCACACVPVCACVRARPRACARACVCASRPHAGCDHRRLFCDTKDRSLPFTLTSKRRALRRFTSTRNSLSPACASERASERVYTSTHMCQYMYKRVDQHRQEVETHRDTRRHTHGGSRRFPARQLVSLPRRHAATGALQPQQEPIYAHLCVCVCVCVFVCVCVCVCGACAHA